MLCRGSRSCVCAVAAPVGFLFVGHAFCVRATPTSRSSESWAFLEKLSLWLEQLVQLLESQRNRCGRSNSLLDAKRVVALDIGVIGQVVRDRKQLQ